MPATAGLIAQAFVAAFSDALFDVIGDKAPGLDQLFAEPLCQRLDDLFGQPPVVTPLPLRAGRKP